MWPPLVSVVTSLVLGSVLCAGGGAQAASASPDIQGGTSDLQDSYAVGVCGGTPGACSLECSGVLIAPNLVVTARHCVEYSNDDTITCPTSQFGTLLQAPAYFTITTSAGMGQATTGWHDVSQLWILDAGDSDVCGGDIALLLLSDVIASTEAVPATPNVFAPLTDESSFEPALVAIGYGLSSGLVSSDSAGIRRIKEDVPILCLPADPDPTLDCDPSFSTSVGANEFVGGQAACPGDSGSGAFAQAQFDDGTPLVIGVLSRGSTDPNDPSQCLSGVYTRLDGWSSFLVEKGIAAAQLGGYPPPAWTVADAGLPGSPLSTDAGAPADAAPESESGAGDGGIPEPVSRSGGCVISLAHPTDAPGMAIPGLILAVASARRRRRPPRQLS